METQKKHEEIIKRLEKYTDVEPWLNTVLNNIDPWIVNYMNNASDRELIKWYNEKECRYRICQYFRYNKK